MCGDIMKVFMLSQGYPSTEYPMNGIHQFAYAKALKKHGIDVVFVALDVRSFRRKRKWGTESLTIEDIPVYAINIPLGRVSPKLMGKISSMGLNHLMKSVIAIEGEPDIIHSHFTETSYAVALYNKGKYPYIISEHSSVINKLSKDEIPERIYETANYTYHNCDKLVVGSPVFQDRIESLFGIRPICIPTISNTDFFKLSQKSSDYYKVISVGNLKISKGHMDTINAFSKAFNGIDARLFIIGEGDDRPKIEELITNLHEEDRIILLGQRNLSFISKEFSDSNLFVLASHSETYGKVYIEAMNAGLPIITTDNGGSEQFVKPFNGVIAKVKDVDSLAEAFRHMYNLSSEFDRAQIRQFAIDNFSEEVATKKHIELYKDLLKEKNRK